MPLRALLFGLSVLLAVQPAVAQENDTKTAPAPSETAAPTKETADADEGVELSWLVSNIQLASASQQAESIREAPVPTTVITADMIKAIGGRNLRDVLTTYVPGMTQVEDHNEMNVAMRGVYASSQQKILILLDGHRLNSRAYSSADPDYSISLDKVKQIEVLRGPGSSSYGNVALAAVINIVTKDGKDVDGVSARVGGGGYGQKTGSLLLGKSFGTRHDLLVWANFYEAKGEPRFVSADQSYSSVPADGLALLHGIRNPTSYDIGLKYNLGDFSLLLNTRNGGIVESFSSSGPTGELYNPSQYRTLQNIGPGLSSRSNHGELKYAHDFSSMWNFEVRGYYDTNDIGGVLVSNPNTVSASFLSWNEDSVGGIAQGRFSYENGKPFRGNLTFGAQVDHMRLLDSSLPTQTGGNWTTFGDTPQRKLLEPGNETIYSGYLQLKQWLGEQLILNAGARYDEKDRHQGPNVRDVSPRVALIYNPITWLDMKLTYARSFVDAPYWYRYNSLASYRGGADLLPEHLSSVQFNPTVRFLDGRITNSLNFFYNDLYDFIFRNNLAAADEPIYQNAGSLKSLGLEEEFVLAMEWYRISANLTWQRALSGSDYGLRGGRIYNIPQITANIVADINPFYQIFKFFGLNVNLHYMGPQLSPIDIRYANGVNYSEPDRMVRGYVLCNVGVRITQVYFKGLSLDATVYNLFNTYYEQGGSTTHPLPQPGRWFLLNLGYAFDPLPGV